MGEYTRLSCCLLLCWACSGPTGGRVQTDSSDAGVSGGTGGVTTMGGRAGASVGGSAAIGGSAGTNSGGSATSGSAGMSTGGSIAGGSAGTSTGGSATGGSTGITPECSAVGSGPAPDYGQCTKDSDCPNLSSPPVPTFCDRGLCLEIDSTGVNRHGQQCVLPVGTNLCGPLVCTEMPDSQPSCRYPNECMVDADCSHLVPTAGMKAVCNMGVCELATTACRDGWECENDADCASEFCDLGRCARHTLSDNLYYGQECIIDPEDPILQSLCGVYPCRALSDSSPRCRSCEVDADCHLVGNSSTCQAVAGNSVQSCTQ